MAFLRLTPHILSISRRNLSLELSTQNHWAGTKCYEVLSSYALLLTHSLTHLCTYSLIYLLVMALLLLLLKFEVPFIVLEATL